MLLVVIGAIVCDVWNSDSIDVKANKGNLNKMAKALTVFK